MLKNKNFNKNIQTNEIKNINNNQKKLNNLLEGKNLQKN